MRSNNKLTISLFIIFAVSGFSGLIYESIWTHYLKLVLGHAAYAQTLVLAIFMGGMAIGAWLISDKSRKISNPILVYAIIELVVGIFALVFHKIFLVSQGFLYESILVNVDSTNAAVIIRWFWAAMLILPQSILLGATFPLMSAGIVRVSPDKTGSILSMLYFTNSIGAAIGVLVSGFVLIDFVGLPGTILTAGLLNIFLAIFVWALTKQYPVTSTTVAKETAVSTPKSYSNTRIILVAAFLTGLASFFYEIGWIRMLSLVLGTTTQAFELMLSAFITGIAFGGLWIRRHIDNIKNILKFAGYVQIVMGLMAVSTLVMYNSTFDFMAFMMDALKRNESGYNIFISSSHLIAFVIMVPTTFFAGMTLPLLTFSYMKAGYGERGIGRVYAANTLGSIIGIFLAIHFVMPNFGLKNLISLGCLVDILLGVTLIYWGAQKQISIKSKVAISASLILFITVISVIEFDGGKMASGVYRHGVMKAKAESIIFQKDGKTSTVVVIENKLKVENIDHHRRSILTNGKSDASVSFSNTPPSGDEPTMILTSVFPLSAYPEATTAAVIGIGSGISSNTLLKTDRIKKVDTIEIEEAMVEGARLFEHHSSLVYSDSRSQVHIDDAKSFFAVNNKKYDLIISEPSNPWVSGVASLFTKEFYHQIKRHLNSGGVLAQWIQAYEIDAGLLSSIFKALSLKFKYFVAYQATEGDIVLLASDDQKVLTLDSWVFKQKKLADAMARVNIKNMDDLYARQIGTSSVLRPFIQTYEIPANSDYFPVISRLAPKARFLNKNSLDFVNLRYSSVPVLDILDPLPDSSSRYNFTRSVSFMHSKSNRLAESIYSYIVEEKPQNPGNISAELNLSVQSINLYLNKCKKISNAKNTFLYLAQIINVHLPPNKAELFWDKLINKSCRQPLHDLDRKLLIFFKAVGLRNPNKIQKAVAEIDINKLKKEKEIMQYIYIAEMTALLAEKKYTEASSFHDNMPRVFNSTSSSKLIIRLLYGVSIQRKSRI